ncbi:T6SS immunity protein Tli4 family protein [Variovorax sp. dw_954]|uniref:T6SS immunity protein Tli4 family protein n=1 Tax=Variovorax sp. dw_954 TaxID=2720078 RepID=UPI001BD69D67|nr:T6SS immunity protein Tli4 family protein [Variovorax sp. dw_954]
MTALSTRLQPLFEKTKTACFGRFAIDVPETATVVFGESQVPFNTDRVEGEGRNLAEWVRKAEGKLRASKRVPTTSGLTLFEKTIDGELPGQKIVIGYQSSSGSIYTISSFIAAGDDLFVQSSTAGVEPNAPGSDWTLAKELVTLNKFARRLIPRLNDEIPAEPGVCIDGGFIADASGLSHETIPIGIRFNEFSDVHLSIKVTKKDVLVPSDAIDPRLEKAKRNAEESGMEDWYSSIKFLRRGERQIEGWNGFEVLARVPVQGNASENHEFKFKSQGEPNNALKPVLDVQLDTGVKGNVTASQKPSLTDEEAVALWDKLTSSIRVRPVSSTAKKTSDANPRRPLGELAATGRTCPQTGIWQCDDEGNIQNGRRRHFKAGEVMPGIVRAGEQSFLQKLKGEQATYRTGTVWKLVDYEEGGGTS